MWSIGGGLDFLDADQLVCVTVEGELYIVNAQSVGCQEADLHACVCRSHLSISLVRWLRLRLDAELRSGGKVGCNAVVAVFPAKGYAVIDLNLLALGPCVDDMLVGVWFAIVWDVIHSGLSGWLARCCC